MAGHRLWIARGIQEKVFGQAAVRQVAEQEIEALTGGWKVDEIGRWEEPVSELIH